MTTLDELRALLLTTEDLIGRGHSRQSLHRATAAGNLVRIRPGFYADAEVSKLRREERHLIAVLAANHALDGPVFSHWSAAMLHGLPGWGLPLRRAAVSISGDPRGSRVTPLMQHDFCRLEQEEVGMVDGLSVTSPARTVVDLARTCGVGPATAVADAALHRGLVTPTTLDAALQRGSGRRGIVRARLTLEGCDGRSESVAETRTRLIFRDQGVPEPKSQVEIRDQNGMFVARVDFLWPELRVIGECDGFGKYFSGQDTLANRRALAREKDREAALLALGYRIVRWHWYDLETPALLAHRIRQVLTVASA